MTRYKNFRVKIALGLIFVFLFNLLGPIPLAQAGSISYRDRGFYLPEPGSIVHLSQAFNTPILKGIKVYPENPFRFDFILDQGDSLGVVPVIINIQPMTNIQYFLGL